MSTTVQPHAAAALKQKIADKTALVGIVGLGYVGLPLVRAFEAAGFRCVEQGTFEPTADMNRLDEADAVLICVPTPLSDSRDPDLTYVEKTTAAVAESLRPGQLVVLESTTYPGTTRDVMLPILARTGLKPGEDFFLAYSPEREDPGNPDFSADRIPKVVGGLEPNSLELAVDLYRHAVVEVIPVTSCEVAEACKIIENTYRSVNIAMVNELKMLFDRIGIDVWEVINAAKTKPFGYQAFYPGPGLGGHCIPIDPFYLSWVARKHGMPTRFIELAGEINTGMPRYVIARLMEALNEHGKPLRGSEICVLGLAYKRDVDDTRESPSFELMEQLLAAGAAVTYSDPHVPKLPKKRDYDFSGMGSQELTPEFLGSLDAVLIATDHEAFDYETIVRHAPLVLDTRNATRDVTEGREKIYKA